MAATPIGVTPMDTGEFLLGTVAVTPVFFESNGEIDPQTQNWTPEEIDHVLGKVSDGVHWWSETLDTLDTVHSLDFVIDDTFARDPVETPYEPIDNRSSRFNEYVGDFVTSLGYGDATSIEDAIRQFNHAQRTRLETDWAFTIFVVDSSDDPDGLFASGGSFAAAFAFAGGLFFITPSTRPASTFAHEMGHIFWARDEYSGGGSWTDQRGYYNTQNLNASDNPAPGFEQQISIMRGGVPLNTAYDAHVSPQSTLAQVGWQDSDGDGVFDLADVPLDLDAVGYFDAESMQYHLSGTASAVPLMNQNSSGTQSDITLNRISQLQYSLDGGPWMVAAEPDQQVVEFDFSLTLQQPFSTIHWRAIDSSTGIASPVIEGTSTLPALSASSITGLAFVDDNQDGLRGIDEPPLMATEVKVSNADGSPLFGGQVDAAQFDDGEIDGVAGVVLAADGVVFDPQVGSFVSDDGGSQRVFHAFDQQRNRWVDQWSSKVALEAVFEQPVGSVHLQAVGVLAEAGFARLEAYDADGRLIGRTTSQAIERGQQVSLDFSDSLGRIASIRAMGHAGTSVALNDLRFGSQHTVATDESGAWRVSDLPDGSYRIDLIPQRVVHQFAQSSRVVDVVAGGSEFVAAAAVRIDSPRYNALLPEDANQDGSVTSRDALVIINELGRTGTRVLQASETSGFAIDVSNDGLVTARDALLVINSLGEVSGQGGDQDGEAVSSHTASQGRLTGHLQSAFAETSPRSAAKMFNSAGGNTADTSADRSDADTLDQAVIVWRPVATELGDFPSNSRPMTNDPTDSGQENAAELDLSIDLIATEISEPF